MENAAEFGLAEKLAQANYFAGEHFLREVCVDFALPFYLLQYNSGSFLKILLKEKK